VTQVLRWFFKPFSNPARASRIFLWLCLPCMVAAASAIPPPWAGADSGQAPSTSSGQAPSLPQVVWSEAAGISRAPILIPSSTQDTSLLAAVVGMKNADKTGSLLRYSLFSRSSLPGAYPTAVPNPYLVWSFPAPIWSLPALADVNEDSFYETFVATIDGRVACLAEGEAAWEFRGFGAFYSSPAVGDVDQDGESELVVGSRDHFVYCLDAIRGKLKWRFLAGGDVDSSPALADLQGDGGLEVVFGSDDGFVYCLSGQDGTCLWSFRANWWVTASPTIADLEGNGSLEVLVGDQTGVLYCLDGATGELIWSFPTPEPIASEAAIADLDGDGSKEVFFGADALYCLNSSGSLLWKFAPGEYFACTPLLLAGRTTGWVIIPGDNLYCLDAATGNLIWQRSISPRGLFDASADLRPDGDLSLALSTGYGELLLLRCPQSLGVTSIPWPKPRANLQNTGLAP